MLFLVDRGNIARASGRNVFASAARFIGTLPPADRVGLAVVPGPGPVIEFTPERDEVRKALRGVLGQGQSDHGAFRVPLDEAVRYLVHRDRFSWQGCTDLECAFQIDPQRVEECRLELEGQAAQVWPTTGSGRSSRRGRSFGPARPEGGRGLQDGGPDLRGALDRRPWPR